MAAAAILKNPKIEISRQLFDQSARNLAWLSILALRSGSALKISNLYKSKMVKNRKMTARHDIRHGEAHWLSEGHRQIKFRTFKVCCWKCPVIYLQTTCRLGDCSTHEDHEQRSYDLRSLSSCVGWWADQCWRISGDDDQLQMTACSMQPCR